MKKICFLCTLVTLLAQAAPSHYDSLADLFKKGTVPSLASLATMADQTGKCFREKNPDVSWDMTLVVQRFFQNDNGPLFPAEALGYAFGTSDGYYFSTKKIKIESREGAVYTYHLGWLDRDLPLGESVNIGKGVWTVRPIVASADGVYFSEAFSLARFELSADGNHVASATNSFWLKRSEPYYILYAHYGGDSEYFEGDGDPSHVYVNRSEYCYF
jgi:hypothetical protein